MTPDDAGRVLKMRQRGWDAGTAWAVPGSPPEQGLPFQGRAVL